MSINEDLGKLLSTLEDLTHFTELKIRSVQEFEWLLMNRDEAFWDRFLLDKLSPDIKQFVTHKLNRVKSQLVWQNRMERINTVRLECQKQQHAQEELQTMLESVEKSYRMIQDMVEEAREQAQPMDSSYEQMIQRLEEPGMDDKQFETEVEEMKKMVASANRTFGERKRKLENIQFAFQKLVPKVRRNSCPIQFEGIPKEVLSLVSSSDSEEDANTPRGPIPRIVRRHSQEPRPTVKRLEPRSKKHRCPHPFCEKKYRSQHELTRHSYTHTRGWPHVCKWCGNGYAYASELESHVRNHTGERPFKCEPCDKAFKTKQVLSAHYRSQTHRRNAVVAQ